MGSFGGSALGKWLCCEVSVVWFVEYSGGVHGERER